MTIRDFIREHRAELEQAIGRSIGHVPATASCDCPKSRTDHYHDGTENAKRLNEADLRQWILNDEGLYSWARSEGVRV